MTGENNFLKVVAVDTVLSANSFARRASPNLLLETI